MYFLCNASEEGSSVVRQNAIRRNFFYCAPLLGLFEYFVYHGLYFRKMNLKCQNSAVYVMTRTVNVNTFSTTVKDEILEGR